MQYEKKRYILVQLKQFFFYFLCFAIFRADVHEIISIHLILLHFIRNQVGKSNWGLNANLSLCYLISFKAEN